MGTPGRRLGIVGCGAIGTLVAKGLERDRSSFRVTALFDTFLASARRLSRELASRPKVCGELGGVLSNCDMVLEAASVQAASQVAGACLKRRIPLVMMSTGAMLLDQARLSALARKYRTKIYLPSGALCGLDGLKAAQAGGKATELRITTTKPPAGFAGAPGLDRRLAVKLSRSQKPFSLYNGGIRGAVRRFPANVNVAATAGLASGVPGRWKVKVVADPGAEFNQHALSIKGDFGELWAVTRNRPSRQNPKTSALAIQSALALFRRLESYVEIGT